MTAPIDHHLESLGTYVKDRLNEAGAALSAPMIVVEDVSYLGDFNSTDKFPLLLIYRTGGKGYGGDRREFWEIVYLLSNYGDVYDVPRVLAWVFEDHNDSNIINLLINYFSQTQCNGLKLDVNSLDWNYLYRTAIGNSAGGRLKFTLSA
jgi:hypothetical protein